MLDLDWSSLGATKVELVRLMPRLDATVAEVRLDGSRDVIVKQSYSEERAEHEYRVLSMLHNVPRVLLYQPPVIVMERAPGITLDRLFRTKTGLLDGLARAGAWLAEMQTATRSSTDPRAILEAILSMAISDADLTGIRAHERLRELAKNIDVPFVTGHHGDYWPGNVFIDDARTTVIDFEGFREGLPLEDVAYFLIRIDLLRRRFFVRAHGLAEAFFEGYGTKPDADALKFFTLTKGLRTLANNTGGNLPLPQRWWTRRVIRGAVHRAFR